jgi:hypothetical protein
MPYALVIVEKPEDRPWSSDTRSLLDSLPQQEGVSKMNESALLIDAATNPLSLCDLLKCAHSDKLVHHVFFYDQKPSYTTYQK